MPGIGQTEKELQVQIYELKGNEVKVKHVEMDVLVGGKKKKNPHKKNPHRSASSE